MQKKLATTDYVDNHDLNYLSFDVYAKYGITDPKEGLKKIWNEIPMGYNRPTIIFMNCGSLYTLIVQATEPLYGSAIIFGYSSPIILYSRIINGIWY